MLSPHLDELHRVQSVLSKCRLLVCGADERAYETAEEFDVDMRELGRARFCCMYSVQCNCVSHGMGGPSVSICMNELTGHRRGQHPRLACAPRPRRGARGSL